MSEFQNNNEFVDDRMTFTREYLDGLKQCLNSLFLEQVAEVIGYLEGAQRTGSQIFIMGNGGSAATASHMACDLGKNIFPKGVETLPDNSE